MKKVLVGMSGGVDSSVTAALLVEQGYDVTGVTFKLWNPFDDIMDREDTCCSLDDINAARDICDELNIPYYVFNFKDVFKKNVVENFVDEYKKGRTPNPCVICNKKIKFEHFFNKAMAMGFDYIATGHYARIEKINDKYYLKKAIYDKKDQSYFLYNIPYSHLEKTLFPLGKYEKSNVREMAKKFGFQEMSEKKDSQEICFVDSNGYVTFLEGYTFEVSPKGNFLDKKGNILGFQEMSEKKDSQEICFVDSNGYVTFLEGYTFEVSPKGNFLDKKGNILGKHKGLWHYTIGQRKGLGISFNKPMYVYDIDAENNNIILSEEKDIFSNTLIASNLNWISEKPPEFPIRVETKIRNQSPLASSIIEKVDQKSDKIKVIFDSPQRAITKGQSAVFYSGDIVIGGGIIE